MAIRGSRPYLYVACLIGFAVFSPIALGQQPSTPEDVLRQRIRDRLDALAARLEAEAAAETTVLASIQRAPALETGQILSESAPARTGIGKLLDSLPSAHQPLTASVEVAEANRTNTSTTLTDQSESLRSYAQHVRQLSEHAASEPLGLVLHEIEGTYVPSDVAIVISPGLANPAPKPGEVRPFGAPPPIRADSTSGLMPFIVGMGQATVDYPAVGAVLYTDPATAGLSVRCTGTLIAPYAVLTAQHCTVGVTPQAVYFQHAGAYLVDNRQTDKFAPYAFPEGDLAILYLTKSVVGITPIEPNDTSALPVGTVARIVGYGFHNDLSNAGTTGAAASTVIVKKTGIKVHADVTSSKCQSKLANKKLICWNYSDQPLAPLEGSTCEGDSGGPLFVSGNPWRLAGVTSGGITCQPGDTPVDTEVFSYVDWIAKKLKKHSVPPPGPGLADYQALLPTINDETRYILESSDRYLDDSHSWSRVFLVPTGLAGLRVAVNATSSGSSLHLLVGPQGTSATKSCDIGTDDTAVVCEFDAPASGTWSLTVSGLPWQEYQVVATRF
jgi:hypothetical protein